MSGAHSYSMPGAPIALANGRIVDASDGLVLGWYGDGESDEAIESRKRLESMIAALAARDERIAALESHVAFFRAFFRSLVNVRGGDEAIEQIAARVGADLARRAAEWEQMADDVGAANVEASARIAALEAGLRDVLADLDGALAEADNIARGRPGMQVSYHGPFAAALRLPSAVGDLRRMACTLRALADGAP